MKFFLVMLTSVLIISGVTCGQTPLGPEQVIRRIIDSGSFEGHDQKIIAGMGDAAAVLVTKVVAGRQLAPNEIDGVLVVLDISFAGQAKIVSDKEPRTALFVLQFCDSATQDPELKKRIDQTRQRIRNRRLSQDTTQREADSGAR